MAIGQMPKSVEYKHDKWDYRHKSYRILLSSENINVFDDKKMKIYDCDMGEIHVLKTWIYFMSE